MTRRTLAHAIARYLEVAGGLLDRLPRPANRLHNQHPHRLLQIETGSPAKQHTGGQILHADPRGSRGSCLDGRCRARVNWFGAAIACSHVYGL